MNTERKRTKQEQYCTRFISREMQDGELVEIGGVDEGAAIVGFGERVAKINMLAILRELDAKGVAPRGLSESYALEFRVPIEGSVVWVRIDSSYWIEKGDDA